MVIEHLPGANTSSVSVSSVLSFFPVAPSSVLSLAIVYHSGPLLEWMIAEDSQIILLLFAICDSIEHLPYPQGEYIQDKYNVISHYFTAYTTVWGENFQQNITSKSNM